MSISTELNVAGTEKGAWVACGLFTFSLTGALLLGASTHDALLLGTAVAFLVWLLSVMRAPRVTGLTHWGVEIYVLRLGAQQTVALIPVERRPSMVPLLAELDEIQKEVDRIELETTSEEIRSSREYRKRMDDLLTAAGWASLSIEFALNGRLDLVDHSDELQKRTVMEELSK